MINLRLKNTTKIKFKKKKNKTKSIVGKQWMNTIQNRSLINQNKTN